MRTLLRTIRTFAEEDAAVTSVEYAVMLAAILMAALAGILVLGEQTNSLFSDARTQMESHGVQ